MPDYVSTGPKTNEGKAISSQNALKSGLFARRDYIRPGEEEEYAQLRTGIWAEINPEGAIEEALAEAILGAAWRLRRCGVIEAQLARPYPHDGNAKTSASGREAGIAETSLIDPMADGSTSCVQASVDRTRSQAHSILRRSLSELRRLQTDRTIRYELFVDEEVIPDPDLTAYKEVIAVLAQDGIRRLRKKKVEGTDTFEGLLDRATAPPAISHTSFCKTDSTISRSAPCPCGSGLKFKRCCGKSAPAVLNPPGANRQAFLPRDATEYVQTQPPGVAVA